MHDVQSVMSSGMVWIGGMCGKNSNSAGGNGSQSRQQMTLRSLMRGTLWFWVIILFAAQCQLVAKIRSRIYSHSLARLRLVGITQADNQAAGVLSGRTAAGDQSHTLNQSGLSKTRSLGPTHS